VGLCYGLTCGALALAVVLQGRGGLGFWLPWAAASLAMQQQAALLHRPDLPASAFGRHFAAQVRLGALLLLAVILSTLA
jgi:4-hydroxybenzoate polyprenyltransferase